MAFLLQIKYMLIRRWYGVVQDIVRSMKPSEVTKHMGIFSKENQISNRTGKEKDRKENTRKDKQDQEETKIIEKTFLT